MSFDKTAMTLSLFGLISIAGVVAAQLSTQDETRSGLRRARGLLEGGEFRTAESSYVALIGKIPQEQRTALSTAHFGRAFAAQKRLFSGDTLNKRTPVDTILHSYELAARLNETGFREAAENNIAQLLRALGRHEEAIGRFNNAAKFGAKTKQASYLFNAGREYMTLADTSKARVNYQEALKADPGATEALRGLLLLQLQSDSASTILQTIAPLRGDSASASAVADALTSLLQSRVRSLNAAEASTALLYLAQSLPAARIGPPSFDVAFADRLRQVSASPSPIAEGVVALVNAYTVRATTYAPPPQSSWWQSSETYRAAWSSILRSLGDWYDQQNNPQVARSYYEASIGRGSWSLMESWIDKRALLPLALIYSRTDSGKDVEFQNKVAQLTEMLFYGKGAAYARGDLEDS